MNAGAVIGWSNKKLGSIPSTSVRPVTDCSNCGYCAKQCYAKGIYARRPMVRRAWDHNSWLVHHDIYTWERSIVEQLQTRRTPPERFRYNVGGDVVSRANFLSICRIARRLPGVKFLLFTKAFQFVVTAMIPANLSVVLSVFPGMKVPRMRLPRAYTGEIAEYPGDKRAARAAECSGSCIDCARCWDLVRAGGDVRFHIHK